MKRIVAIALCIFCSTDLLSAHRAHNTTSQSPNKQIVTGRQLSPAQAACNVITHSNLSDQIRFLQWKQDRMEQQLKETINLLTQIKSIVIPILRNQQYGAEFSMPTVCQQQPAQHMHPNSQTAGTTYSGPQVMHNGNSASGTLPYQAPQFQHCYAFDPVTLLNAAAYTQMCTQQHMQQQTPQFAFTQQAITPAHQYPDCETEESGNDEVLTGESRFLQLMTEWNESHPQERHESKKQKQQ